VVLPELLDYASKFPAFRGEIEFDWSMAFLGQSVDRQRERRPV
jgi:hypothetical protein